MTTLDHINDAPDPSSVSPWPIAVRYGLIGGLISIIYGAIGLMTGFASPSAGFGAIAINSIISIGIFVGIIVFAVKTHRDEELGGFISFGRIVLIGVIITLISGIMSTIFQHIYMNYIDPTFMDTILEQTQAMLENLNVPEDVIEESMAKAAESNTLTARLQGFLYLGIFGAIVSAIIGAVMKKNPPEYA